MAPEFVSAFRIVKPQWASTATDGEGARLYGGRWNSLGVPMVYLAGSRALAALEMLAHLTPESRRLRFSLIEIRFPKSCVEVLDVELLPADWSGSPASERLKMIGDEWVSSQRSLVLQVPSALVVAESNYLVNPRHPDAAKLLVGEPVDWQFDPRL